MHSLYNFNLFPIGFVADESHIKFASVHSESTALTHNHFLVGIPLNLVAALFTPPVYFFFCFGDHFAFFASFFARSTMNFTPSVMFSS